MISVVSVVSSVIIGRQVVNQLSDAGFVSFWATYLALALTSLGLKRRLRRSLGLGQANLSCHRCGAVKPPDHRPSRRLTPRLPRKHNLPPRRLAFASSVVSPPPYGHFAIDPRPYLSTGFVWALRFLPFVPPAHPRVYLALNLERINKDLVIALLTPQLLRKILSPWLDFFTSSFLTKEFRLQRSNPALLEMRMSGSLPLWSGITSCLVLLIRLGNIRFDSSSMMRG